MRASLRAVFYRVLPTLLVCIGLLEVGLRLSGRRPSNTTEGIFAPHGSAYRLRRNLDKVSRTPSFTTTIITNDMGFRDRAPGKRELGAVPYIAWVGDSITFANGVDYDQSFVGVFDELAAQRGVESANLAVGGHRFSDEEETLYEFLEAVPVKPTWVIIVFTAMGITTFEQRYDDIMVKDGYLFPTKRWWIPYVTVTLGNTSSAYCFFRDGVRGVQARLRSGNPKSGLEILGDLFAKRGPWGRAEVPARFEARLAHLDERIRHFKAEPIYVYLPSGVDLRAKEFLALPGHDPADYDFEIFLRLLQHHAERAGVHVVNLLPLLQAHHDAGERLTFALDPHYDVAANRIIGMALRDTLLGEAGLLAPATMTASRGHP